MYIVGGVKSAHDPLQIYCKKRNVRQLNISKKDWKPHARIGQVIETATGCHEQT
jgi:hypothetical protein